MANTLVELREKKAQIIREWKQARDAMLAPVEAEIAQYLYSESLKGRSVSQLCREYGTKDRRTVLNYLSLGKRISPGLQKLTHAHTWDDVATVEKTAEGHYRVTVENVPLELWTQDKVSVEDGYSGWIEYMPDGRTVFQASEKISPLHAENGIKMLFAKVKM